MRLLVRAVVGAVAGVVAGAGFLLTLEAFTRYCNGGMGRTGCGAGFSLTFGLNFSIWMIVAAALICAGFRILRAERAWWAAAAGSGLWFALVLSVIYGRIFHLDGMYQEDVHRLLVIAYLATACAAYAIAGLCTGLRRTA